MSGAITTVMAELADALGAATGLPATTDPEKVLPTLAETGACVLVGPPVARLAGISGRLDLEIPVHLACLPPGSWADFMPVWDALPAALNVCGPTDTRPVALSVGEAIVPAYSMTAHHSLSL